MSATIRVKKIVLRAESAHFVASYEVAAEAVEGKKRTPISIEVQFDRESVAEVRNAYAFVNTTEPVEMEGSWLPSFEEASVSKVRKLTQQVWDRARPANTR
jgi:hypothetical protein